MGRQVGCTGLVRIGELLGEEREEERDDNRKDIFWGVEEDEVVDHLLGIYCRLRSFLYAFSRSGACQRLALGSQVFSDDGSFPCGQVPAIFAVAVVSYDPINFILFFSINQIGRAHV